MLGFEYGFKKAIDEFIEGISKSIIVNHICYVTSLIIISFITINILNSPFPISYYGRLSLLSINLLNTLILLLEVKNTAKLAFKMFYWKNEYILGRLFGWLLSLIFLAAFDSATLNKLDILVYFGVPLAILAMRLTRKSS